MAYNYLLDLYRVLSERQAEIEKSAGALETSLTLEHYRQGRLAANQDFLTFLKENYHAKLPRRMQ